MLKIVIHNAETNEIIEREMTPEELIKWEANQEQIKKDLLDKQTKAIQRQTLLDKLGITEDEARLLLGGN